MDGSTGLSCTRPGVPPSAQLGTRYIRQNQVRKGSTHTPTMPAPRAQESNLRIEKRKASERIQKIKSLRKQTKLKHNKKRQRRKAETFTVKVMNS